MDACFRLFIIGKRQKKREDYYYARSRGARAQLQNIILATHNYSRTYKTIPPQFILDSNDKPILSWRAAISPYLDNPINLSLAWDSEKQKNSEAAKNPYNMFQTFNRFNELKVQETNFIAITGEGTVWSSKPFLLTDEQWDLRETIFILEIPNTGIHWMEPRDFTIEEFLKIRKAEYTPGNYYWIGYANGEVRRYYYEDIMKLTKEDFMVKRGEVEVE